MKITPEQVSSAYVAASSVYDGKLTFEKAANELHKKHGLNINSARDFINQFRCMMKGEVFTRTLSAYAIEYFLAKIHDERGLDALERALVAAWKHVEYYERIQRARLIKFRAVLDSFQQKVKGALTIDILNNRFSAEVQNSIRDTAEARKARLQKAKMLPSKISLMTAIFQRNPDVIAEVLLRAKGKCEQCNKPAPFKRKKDGTPYLEVHHKIQLADGGEDSVVNAIALCPNCHRQQHFG